MLLLSSAAGPRLRFVLRFLSDYYGHSFTVTTNREAFLQAPGPKAVYGAEDAAPVLFRPSGLLEERGIRALAPACSTDGAFPVLFADRDGGHFDLFSAVFFLLSRYEEYTHWVPDTYGRFDYRAGTAWRHGFLHRPLVNEWLEAFRTRLRALGVPIAEAAPPRRWVPTYDIDIAWSYRGKGWLRNGGGALRDAARGDWHGVRERLQVIRKQAPDPYDAYEVMESMHREGERPRFFFHCGRERNRYDKAIPHTYPPWRALVRRLSQTGGVGLHPSWASGDRPALLQQEQRVLEAALGAETGASRQHYIRFRLPATFRMLIEAGIRDDYSMGYGSVNGYRASVAHPFPWYDLEREETTPLMLHPFAWMDANSFFEQRLGPEAALEELKGYWEELGPCGGTLITIAHNTFLGTDHRYAGWGKAYRAFSALVHSPPQSARQSG